MARKTTQKNIKGLFAKVLKINFLKLDGLLQFTQPTYYNSGRDGWCSDIFIIDYETAISTGRKPFGNVEPNKNITNNYNLLGKKLYNKKGLQGAETALKLLLRYCREVTR